MNLLQGLSNALGGSRPGQSGRLQVTVVEARRLARKDLLSKSDPYCLLTIGGKHDMPLANHIGTHYKTSVINNNQDPVWNQTFTFNVKNSENELLRVKCYDYDHMTFDDLIGDVDIPLFSLKNGVPKDDWYQLSPAKGGAVRLVLLAQGFGMTGGGMGQQAGGFSQQMPQQQQFPQQQFQQQQQQFQQQQFQQRPFQQQAYYPPPMAPPVAYPVIQPYVAPVMQPMYPGMYYY